MLFSVGWVLDDGRMREEKKKWKKAIVASRVI